RTPSTRRSGGPCPNCSAPAGTGREDDPMAWERIRGHDAARKQLLTAYRRGRLAHAYLFVGPEGVGKRLFATELAKAILCEDRKAERLEACDLCPACMLVDAGTHPDFAACGRPEDSLELPIAS